MSIDRMELPQGTLELLMLKTVALEPHHGYEMTRRGRAQLETQTEAWRKLTITIGRVPEAN